MYSSIPYVLLIYFFVRKLKRTKSIKLNSVLGESFNSVLNKRIIFFLFLSLIVVCAMLLSYSVGRQSFKSKEYFLIYQNDPELVILERYNDKFIAAKFDKKEKTILKEFTLLNPVMENFETKKIFKLEKIGPLRPVE